MIDGDDIRTGFTVQFSGDPTWAGKFYKVIHREGLEYVTGNTSAAAEFSTVATGGVSGFKDIKALQPDKSPQRAAYVEWGVKDGEYYQFKLKSGTIRLGPDGDKNAARVTSLKSPWYDPDPSLAFWLVNDWIPSFQATNTTPFTLTPQVFFRGFKYDLQELSKAEVDIAINAGRYSVITLGGVTSF